MIAENVRLKPFDFLIDAARMHFKENGVLARSFIVPAEMLEELKTDKRTILGGFPFLAYAQGMLVLGSQREEPILIDSKLNQVPLL